MLNSEKWLDRIGLETMLKYVLTFKQFKVIKFPTLALHVNYVQKITEFRRLIDNLIVETAPKLYLNIILRKHIFE